MLPETKESERNRKQRERRDPEGIEVTMTAFRDKPAKTSRADLRVEAKGGKFGNGVVRGVSLIESGEALGHGFDIDETTIDQVTTLAGEAKNGIKSRFTHPDMCNDGLGNTIGRIYDPKKRKDGDGHYRSYGDLHIFASADPAKRNHVLGLAAESPDSLGISVVISGSLVRRLNEDGTENATDANGDDLPPVYRVKELHAADVVDEPAANTAGLFGVDDIAMAAGSVFDHAWDQHFGAKPQSIPGESELEPLLMQLASAEPMIDLIVRFNEGDLVERKELLSSQAGLDRVAGFVTRQLNRRGVIVPVTAAMLSRVLTKGKDSVPMTREEKAAADALAAKTKEKETPTLTASVLSAAIVTALAAAGFTQPTQAKPDAAIAKDEAAALAERTRILNIQALSTMFPDSAEHIDPLLAAGITGAKSLSEVQASVMSKLAEVQKVVQTAGLDLKAGQTEREKFSTLATDAILAKGHCIAADSKNDDHRKRFGAVESTGLIGMGAKRLASKCLRMAGVRDTDDLDDETLWFKAMNLANPGHAIMGDMRKGIQLSGAYAHGTSDFPLILANAGNKSILHGWEMALVTWDQWCRIGNLNDFKTAKRLRLSESGLLDERPEGTPAQEGTFNERGEDIFLKNYAKAFSYTRQMFINDDLGAFTDIGRRYGNGGNMTIEVLVYTNLTSNAGVGPTMADTLALFHATHANLNASSQGAPDQTRLEAMNNAMMIQAGTGEDGASIPSGAPAKFYLAKPILASAIDAIIHAPYRGTAGLDQPQDAGLRAATAIGVPYLAMLGNSAWFGVADQNAAPSYEVAFLNGQKTMRTKVVVGTTVDGVKIVVDMDFATGPTGGWEGIARNAG